MRAVGLVKSVLFCLGIAALACAATYDPAAAATATTTFNVTATVQATCTVSASPLGFGTYQAVDIPATTTISVTCTNTTPYGVGLDAGTFSGATVTTRKMSGPDANGLPYFLYQDSGHSTNWGNTKGTDTVAGTGNGSAQTLTVYGDLPANEFVKPGSYTDTITATVYY